MILRPQELEHVSYIFMALSPFQAKGGWCEPKSQPVGERLSFWTAQKTQMLN